jgi:hypothetical protein
MLLFFVAGAWLRFGLLAGNWREPPHPVPSSAQNPIPQYADRLAICMGEQKIAVPTRDGTYEASRLVAPGMSVEATVTVLVGKICCSKPSGR